MALSDTIAAITTPPGTGGVGLIRISGSQSEDIARRLFQARRGGKNLQSHRLYHGDIISAATGAVLDEVLLTVMRKPRSYTGEDTVEINCHGGELVTRSILREVLHAGARLADPGEFTKRAFLNNRIDLSQAEAVLDMITAQTDRAREAALSQLKGDLSRKIEGLRTAIMDILAALEAAIDFPEEEADAPIPRPFTLLEQNLRTIIADINALVSTYDEGKICRGGIHAVITGKANVGKSSLLNRLLGEQRAIVTPLPGTTRDFIEEKLFIGGLMLTLTDTAGIRVPENVIEQEGIALVRERLSRADIVIMVFDGSGELTGEDREIVAMNRSRKTIPVFNKADLPSGTGGRDIADLFPGRTPLRISAKYGDGIPALVEAIQALAGEEAGNPQTEFLLTNIRHKNALEKTVGLLAQAREAILQGSPPELVSLDIREALDCLGEITGRTTDGEILDRIFSSFCIGK